jgi:hypothetical protein
MVPQPTALPYPAFMGISARADTRSGQQEDAEFAPGRCTNEKALQAFACRASVLAEWTGLEPATPGVTGRYSNQLNYHSMMASRSLCKRHRLGVP